MAKHADREKLKSVYPNEEWAKKVDNMSDAEVIAVLERLKLQNKL